MAMFLRDLREGTRFVLCRTRTKYLLVRREVVKNRQRIVVRRDSCAEERTLHHSCHVKPLVRLSNQ